jgi:hypothetical protein
MAEAVKIKPKLLTKSEKGVIRELHDLIVMKRIVEQYTSTNNEAKKEKLMAMLQAKIKREEHVERHFDHAYTKLENSLLSLKEEEPELFNEIMPLLQHAHFYKNTLISILAGGGKLEHAAKDKDVQKVMADLLEAIKSDEYLARDIKEIQKDLTEIVKKHSNVSEAVNADQYWKDFKKFLKNKNFEFLDFRKFDETIQNGILDDFFIEKNGFNISDEGKDLIKQSGIFVRFSQTASEIHKSNQQVKFVIFLKPRENKDELPLRITSHMSLDGPAGQHSDMIAGREDQVLYAGIVEASGGVSPAGHIGSIQGYDGSPRSYFLDAIKRLFSK